MANKQEYCSPERLYLDADGNVVKADDPKRKSLLVAAGLCMPLEDAIKYGIVREAQAQIIEPVQAEAEAEPAGEPDKKTVSAAPANKAVAASSNKGKK